MLPVLAGVGIKLYRGPHQYTLEQERQWQKAEFIRKYGNKPILTCGIGVDPEGTFWANREFDGTLVRHGEEIAVTPFGKEVTEYRGGKRHGDYRWWSNDGSPIKAGQYENDEEVGEWIEYENGQVARRILYDPIQTVTRVYDPNGQMVKRRIAQRSSGEVQLAEWHSNGQERLKGQLVEEFEVGLWRWWNENGHEIRRVTFDRGVPEELVDIPGLARLMRSRMSFPVRDVPLDDALEYTYGQGFKIRIETHGSSRDEILSTRVSTDESVRGPVAFYLALRDIGLTINMKTDRNGLDALIIRPMQGN
jgi:antitoxin component YwqK of YwqJK toxin-antitoxin module